MIKFKILFLGKSLIAEETQRLKTDVFTNNGVIGVTAVPSGASTGAHEAYELG